MKVTRPTELDIRLHQFYTQGLEGMHPVHHPHYYRPIPGIRPNTTIIDMERTDNNVKEYLQRIGIIYDTLTTSEVSMNKILHTRRMIDTQVGFTGATVRKGTVWVDLTELNEVVDLCVCSSNGEEHEVIGTAKILERWYGIFSSIPARYVEMEQVEQDRNYSSLLSSLQSAYHQRGSFRVDDIVTVLVYQRLS